MTPEVRIQKSDGSGSLISFLAGKKTYLVCALGLVYALGVYFGVWSNESEIWGGLGFTGAMTIRAAIKRLAIAVVADPEFNSSSAEAARRFTAREEPPSSSGTFPAGLLAALLLPAGLLLASCAEYSASVMDRTGNQYSATYKPSQRDPLAGFVK